MAMAKCEPLRVVSWLQHVVVLSMLVVLARSQTTTSEAGPAPVTLTIWTTPNSDWHNELMGSVKDIVIRLSYERIKFEPDYYVHDGSNTCRGENGDLKEECENDCLFQGRYCQVPGGDDDPNYNTLVGADMVLESARRQCIWKITENYLSELFWNYLKEMQASSCDTQLTQECLTDVYAKINLGQKVIDRCMFGSANYLKHNTTNDDIENDVLQGQIELAKQIPVTDIPQVFINGNELKDVELTTTSIFQAVCDAYATGSAPNECKLCLQPNCYSEISSCLQGLSCEAANDELVTSGSNQEPEHVRSTPLESSSDTQPESENNALTEPDVPEQNEEQNLSKLNHDLNSGFGKLTQLVAPRQIFTYQMIQNCEVDFRTPGPLVEALLAGDQDGFLSTTKMCTDQDEEQFTGTSTSFERCAGFDFLEFAEANSQALGTSFFGCLDAFQQSDTGVAIEKCVNLILHTGLWKPVGHFMEYSSQICPCISHLSDLPDCMFQRKESDVLLDGPAVKLSSCLLEQLCTTLEPLCRDEVKSVNQCIPHLDLNEECATTEEHCKHEGALLFLAPFPLTGAAFPDRCQAAATKGDLRDAHVIEKYNKYRRKCVLKEEESSSVARDFGDPDEHKGDNHGNDGVGGDVPPNEGNSTPATTPPAAASTISWQSSASELWTDQPLLTRILAGGVAFLIVLCLSMTCYACQRAKRRYRYSEMQMGSLGGGPNFHGDADESQTKPYRDDFVDEEAYE